MPVLRMRKIFLCQLYENNEIIDQIRVISFSEAAAKNMLKIRFKLNKNRKWKISKEKIIGEKEYDKHYSKYLGNMFF